MGKGIHYWGSLKIPLIFPKSLVGSGMESAACIFYLANLGRNEPTWPETVHESSRLVNRDPCTGFIVIPI